MASPKQFSLGDYKAILLAHEGDYRGSKAGAKHEVVDEIIGEITTGGKGKFKKGSLKALEQVSQFTESMLRSH